MREGKSDWLPWSFHRHVRVTQRLKVRWPQYKAPCNFIT